MLNRVAPKPIDTPQRPGQSAEAEKRPGPSPASAHPTGPAPPFEYGPEPAQGGNPAVPDQRPAQDDDRRR